MSASDLGEEFVEDRSVDWGRVARAVSGSVLAGIFLSVIGVIESVGDLFATAIDGIGEFLSEIILALGIPPITGANIGAIEGLGPLAFPVSVAVVMIAVFAGARLLIGIFGRIL
jgi:hypothetical protein